MPPIIASFEDKSLQTDLADPKINAKWPPGVLAKLELELCCEVRDWPTERRRFPTILFGPGLSTTRLRYSAVAQYLASLGYEIIVMDHPYETDVVQFPNGEIIYSNPISTDNETTMVFLLDVRTRDASFILDTLKVSKTVYIGHSFGGSAAAHALLYDSRVVSGINIDGPFIGPAVQLGVPRAFLALSSQGNSISPPGSASAPWSSFFTSMADKHPFVWTKALSMKDTVHSGYTDFSLIGDVTGLRNDKVLESVVFGKATGKRVMEVFQAYLGDFVQFTLWHGNEGLLAGPSKRFPDVSFLRL